jgi:hypothetical protein
MLIKRTGATNKGSSAYNVTFPNGESHVLWTPYGEGRSLEDEDQEIRQFANELIRREPRLVNPDLEVVANKAGDFCVNVAI